MPTGLALIIVAGLFTTATKSTAHLTVPLAVVLAVAGFLLATRRRERIRAEPGPRDPRHGDLRRLRRARRA